MRDAIKEIIEGKLKKKPAEQHELIYDSNSQTLEPVYFWILDLMNGFFGGKVEKIIDNFVSSPGSGHFSELSGKKSIMQKNAMDQLGAVNQVIKSIINLIYDLKEFELRLRHYGDAESKDKRISEAGSLALKEIWMNTVDMKRGAGSINALASGNLQFVTLRDAFMSANSLEQVEKLDLNDRVKRMLKSRVNEFDNWRKRSKRELESRFNIEKNYLKSQVNTLQLYSRWIKPYLQTAANLEMEDPGKDPELIKTFNTILLELALFGKSEVNVKEEIRTSKLPKGLKIPKRKYYGVVFINFHFRGIPQKAGQHYLFGGKATVTFRGYALNDEELKFFEQELKKSDVEDTLTLIQGATKESLEELQKDIDHFLKTEEKKQEEENKKKADNTNPFSALFSPLFKKSEKAKDKDKKSEKAII